MAASPADDRGAEHGSGSAEEGVGGGGDARRVILSPVHVFNCLNLSGIDAVLLGSFLRRSHYQLDGQQRRQA
jgi:hypothetical protein